MRDIENINLELIFSDLEQVENRYGKVVKKARAEKSLAKERDLLEKIKTALEEGKSAREVELDDEEKKIIKNYSLLSAKPVIYVCNVAEDELTKDDNKYVKAVREYAEKTGDEVVVISAEIESEIAALDEDEKELFLEELGLDSSGLDKLIKSSYKLLGLISFITTGEMETRAWTVKRGSKAPVAAGKIHTDMERGFIKADTISYQDLVDSGSIANARDKGLIRSEGKDYVVEDGDVIVFKFNV